MTDSPVTTASSTTPDDVLRDVFGLADFRGEQRAIVTTLDQGHDAFVLMPTGGGKSLCYQIPAITRDGVAIVVSPLIALMEDQIAMLGELGVRAAALNSSIDAATRTQIESDMRDGRLDLVYMAPERLMNGSTLGLLSRCRLALFAIDEAHCVSQWGHDFRPEYRGLAALADQFPAVPRIALTATADPATRAEIVERLRLENASIFVHSFDRPNIVYRVAERGNARQQLATFIEREHPGQAGIVYCLSRKKTEQTADWLAGRGIDAVAYHAGMDAEARRTTQRRFCREDGVVICATIAFGMGIDKPDVRFVAHLDLPASMEAYYQETGRAGRDGEPADAMMMYGLNDVVQRSRMIEQGGATDARKTVERSKLDAMLSYCELATCRRVQLLAYFGETNAEPCGNCDNCLNPPERVDATREARMLLSAVYRTGQRFGVGYVVDHVRGVSGQRSRNNGDDNHSTFGVGAHETAARWRAVARALLARGSLASDPDRGGGLRLSGDARALLRGHGQIWLRVGRSSPSRGSRPARAAPAIEIEDEPLWEALRARRTQLARERDVPPYVVCSNAALAEIVQRRPASHDQLLDVPGIGDYKSNTYGAALLEVIAEHG